MKNRIPKGVKCKFSKFLVAGLKPYNLQTLGLDCNVCNTLGVKEIFVRRHPQVTGKRRRERRRRSSASQKSTNNSINVLQLAKIFPMGLEWTENGLYVRKNRSNFPSPPCSSNSGELEPGTLCTLNWDQSIPLLTIYKLVTSN